MAFIFSSNNSSLTTGSLSGSQLLSYRRAIYLSLAGLAAGAILEGWKMSRVAIMIAPMGVHEIVLSSSIVVTIALMGLLTYAKIPASIANALVGSLLGGAIASNASLNPEFLWLILVSWITIPFMAVMGTFLLYNGMILFTERLSLITVDVMNRVGVVITVFYLAYSLGANNIGLMNGLSSSSEVGLILSLNLIAVSIGVLLFGKRVAEYVGIKLIGLSPLAVLTAMLTTAILIWLFTQMGIPISLTQVALGGLIGAGLAKRPSMINRRLLSDVLLSWILITLVSILLGYLATTAILRP